MGMFDYISVADTLPTNSEIDAAKLNLYTESFQTKDLDNVMATYYIQGGRLFVEKFKSTEWVEDSDTLIGGYFDHKDPYQEEIKDFHGKINFYHIFDKDDYDHWVEYDAYFTHGKLDKIELVKYKADSNLERKQNMQRWMKKALEESDKWYNKCIFNTKVWRNVRRFICKILYGIERFLGYIRVRMP